MTCVSWAGGQGRGAIGSVHPRFTRRNGKARCDAPQLRRQRPPTVPKGIDSPASTRISAGIDLGLQSSGKAGLIPEAAQNPAHSATPGPCFRFPVCYGRQEMSPSPPLRSRNRRLRSRRWWGTWEIASAQSDEVTPLRVTSHREDYANECDRTPGARTRIEIVQQLLSNHDSDLIRDRPPFPNRAPQHDVVVRLSGQTLPPTPTTTRGSRGRLRPLAVSFPASS